MPESDSGRNALIQSHKPQSFFPRFSLPGNAWKVPWNLPVVLPIPCVLATTVLLCMPSLSSQARHLKLYLKGNKRNMMRLLVTLSDVLKENDLLVIKEFSKVPSTPSLLLKNRKVLFYLLTVMLWLYFQKSE